jgi:DNA-binding NtrC family response regulator
MYLAHLLSHARSPSASAWRSEVPQRSADAVDKLAAMAWPADVTELVRVAQSRVKGTERRKLDVRDQK